MENEIEPKRTISLTWDDPWKKYEERWKKKPRGEGRPLLYSDISRTERPKRKKPKFRKLKVFKQCKQVFSARESPEKDLGVPLKTFLVNWSVNMISASELSKDFAQ